MIYLGFVICWQKKEMSKVKIEMTSWKMKMTKETIQPDTKYNCELFSLLLFT